MKIHFIKKFYFLGLVLIIPCLANGFNLGYQPEDQESDPWAIQSNPQKGGEKVNLGGFDVSSAGYQPEDQESDSWVIQSNPQKGGEKASTYNLGSGFTEGLSMEELQRSTFLVDAHGESEMGGTYRLVHNFKGYFSTNGLGFDHSTIASKSFKLECPVEYPSFSSQLERIMILDHKNNEKSLQEREQLSINVFSLKLACEQKVSTRYDWASQGRNILEKDLKKFLIYNMGGVFNKFIDQQDSPIWAKKIKKVFNESLREISEKCGTKLKLRFGRDKHVVGGTIYPFAVDLERLYRQNCNQKIQALVEFNATKTFQQVLHTPELCKQQTGCVEELQILVGLKKHKTIKSIFESSSEKLSTVEECCSNPNNCEFNNKGNHFQKYDDFACSSVQIKNNLVSRMKSDLPKLCRSVSNKKYNFAKKDLDQFRQGFLQCFVVPSFQKGAFEHHSKNACKQRIEEITEAFKKNNGNIALSFEDSDYKPLARLKAPLDKFKGMDDGERTIAAKEAVKNMCFAKLELEENEDSSKSNVARVVNAINKGIRKGQRKIDQEASLGHSSLLEAENLKEAERWGVIEVQEKNVNLGNRGNKADEKKASDDNPKPFKGTEGNEIAKNEDSEKAQAFSLRSPASNNGARSSFKVGDLKNLGNFFKPGDKPKNSPASSLKTTQPVARGHSETAFLSDQLSTGFRNFGNRFTKGAKAPFQSAYKSIFGDPTKSVQRVFNVHNLDVNLLDKQKELFRQFCRENKCT